MIIVSCFGLDDIELELASEGTSATAGETTWFAMFEGGNEG